MTPILRPLAIQPCRQPALDRLQLVCISCGEGPHVLALEAAGRGNRVFAWGRNGSGELGLPQDECAALSAPRVVDGGAACSNASPHPPWPCPSSARAPPQGGSERLWAAMGGSTLPVRGAGLLGGQPAPRVRKPPPKSPIPLPLAIQAARSLVE